MRVVDSSVAVDHLRGYAPAAGLLDGLLADGVALVSSEIVRFELLGGVRHEERTVLETFFDGLDWMAVTEEIARQAAVFARHYRASHSGICTADYLIAATAQVLDAPLLTRNVRHFPMFAELAAPY
ncbi:type II toxin-antitoxin system VapC family toxin [soil metagenome]